MSTCMGTQVPLLSLGYMCASGWRNNALYNPSSSRVVTREYQHRPAAQLTDNLRGGPDSGDHVDLLGNHAMITDVLAIAAGCVPDGT